jgi:hypothetical protein
MSARDRYGFNLQCGSCGQSGRVEFSEWDRPTAGSGHGRSMTELSAGFVRAADKQGYPVIHCEKCRVEIAY